MDATDTITLNPRLFANLPPANKVYDAPVESLPTLANKIDFIAELVERNWQELPDSLKELAKAYMFHHMTARDEISRVRNALVRLSDVVFSAIERESPAYQRTLGEALDGDSNTLPTTPEEFREWMRSL